MPRGDGTGPKGEGPRTGRGLGSCPPVKDENKTQTGQTRLAGRGRRGGGRFGLRDGTGPRSGNAK